MADSPHPPSSSSPHPPPSHEKSTTSGSRLGAKALFVQDGEVLLIKEGRDDGSSFWTLPGGGVSPGESLRTSLRRELDEELQCTVTCGEPVGSCQYEHTSFGDVTTVYTVFDCSLESQPEANRTEDILECEWVDPDALPNQLLDPFEELLDELVIDGFFEE